MKITFHEKALTYILITLVYQRGGGGGGGAQWFRAPVGVVIRRSWIQGLHPATSRIFRQFRRQILGHTNCLCKQPTGLPPASQGFQLRHVFFEIFVSFVSVASLVLVKLNQWMITINNIYYILHLRLERMDQCSNNSLQSFNHFINVQGCSGICTCIVLGCSWFIKIPF